MKERELKMKLPIYMDCHSTTPLDRRVLDTMLPYLTTEYGNASSLDHTYGTTAANAVEEARARIASLINASPGEIIFTSGATESDNLALEGIARTNARQGRHIITCTIEHRAVLDTCKYLEGLGWSVTYVPVDITGRIDLEKLERSITDSTVLISVMFANNEIGTISPISEIGRISKERGVLFHTDAAQAVGHIPVDVNAMNIDLMSLSAHKVYGPKGIGALYVRRHDPRVKIEGLVRGGGHERGLRSGTLNVPGIVGMGKALEVAGREMKSEGERLRKWTTKMKDAFENRIPDSEQNGHPTYKLPHNLNMFIRGVESKALIQSLRSDVAISAGSACTTKDVEPSYVLLALGHSPERAHSSIRFGLGRHNTEEEIDFIIEAVQKSGLRLRNIRVHQ